MSQTFHCPNCGAPLDPPNKSAATMRCPFCHSSVIVPEELRGRSPGPETISREQAMTNMPESSRQMMEIIQLVRAGNKEEAIHRFREAFGVNQRDAQFTINAIEQNQVVQLSHPQANIIIDSPMIEENMPLQPFVMNAVQNQILGNSTYRTRKISFVVWIFPIIGMLIGLMAVLAVLVQPGAPLYGLWSRISPFGKTRLIFSFGEAGELPGQLSEPENIAIDMDGNIFVADFTTGRIQCFDEKGNFIRLWDAGDGKVVIRALEVDQNGILYAAVDRSIRRYDTRSGAEMEPLPNPDNFFYDDFTILAGGGFGALVDSEMLVRLNEDGSVMWSIDDVFETVSGETDTNGQVAVDGSNNFFLAGQNVKSVFKFSPGGQYLNRFGSEGEKAGQIFFIHAIAVDGQGRIYLNDWGDLEIFGADGQFLDQASLPEMAYDIQFGSNGNLYAVSQKGKVYEFQMR